MRKIYSVITLCLLATALSAAPVDQQTAQDLATAFLRSHTGNNPLRLRATKPHSPRLHAVSADPLYYAFNVGDDEGFVLVSSEDRTPAILAYANSGQFAADSLPVNMQELLDDLAAQILWLRKHPAAPRMAEGEITAKNPISPLIASMWDQRSPYNLKCPTFVNGERCVTGCVATAMAQLMNYHQWPDSTLATIPGYTSSPTYDGGMEIDSIPAGTPINWEAMTDIFQGDESEEQLDAISTLMFAAGASVRMNYRDYLNGGSSSQLTDVPAALQTYFGYSRAMHYEYRQHYTADAWEQLVYDELMAGRPILYQGISSGGGHAFIVDGYSEGFFHINWGWGNDDSDVYCRLTVLSPGNTAGAGASTTLDGYSSNQAAIFGIRRDNGEQPYQGFYLTGTIASVQNNEIVCEFENHTAMTEDFSYGIGYINENGVIKTVKSNHRELTPTNVLRATFIVSGLQPGTYRIFPISKLYAQTTWRHSIDPEKSYVLAEVTDEGTTLTLVEPPLSLAARVEVNGKHVIHEEHTVRVTVENEGEEYYGKIYLLANTTGQKPLIYGAAGITVRTGRSVATDFLYTIHTPDTVFFTVTTDDAGTNVIGRAKAYFADPTDDGQPHVETDAISLQTEVAFEPLTADGTYILGDHPRIRVTVTNPTDSNYVGSMQYALYHYTDGKRYVTYLPSQTQAWRHSLKHHSSEEFYVDDFDGRFIIGDAYALVVRFRKDGYLPTITPPEGLTIVPPVLMYRGDGTLLAEMSRDSCVVPARIAAVDLRQASATSVVRGGNPNTIYLLSADAPVPDGITGNIVRGNRTDALLLADGYDFFTPEDITAGHVAYTRTFRRGIQGTAPGGWNTMTLPFAATRVTALRDSVPVTIDWARSATDIAGDFWLLEFNHQNGDNLVFSPAATFAADRPYLVAVPQATEGAGPNLVGLPITFSADDATIHSTYTASTTGLNYQMNGNRDFRQLEGVMALDSRGSRFELADTTVQAFRAYFTPVRTTTTDALGIRTDITIDAVLAPLAAGEPSAQRHEWYSLQGQRMTAPRQKGIYIRQGRKVVVK